VTASLPGHQPTRGISTPPWTRSTLVQAIDVSSHQPRDLSAIIRQHRPDHVIVRMYLPEENPPQEHSIAQVESARENGCSVGAYVWAYRSSDARQTIRDGLALARRCGLEPPVLWIDCETYLDVDPGPDATWLREAVDECRRAGVQPGIYTGGWWWRDKLGNSTEFADLPLWAAEYCEPRDPASCTLFGGWTRAAGKQWTENPVDRSTFLAEVCGRPLPGRESPSPQHRYNPKTECVIQTGNWQCSAASAAWVLRSVGIGWGQDDVVRWLGGHISPALGLHDSSGRMLAELFKAQGLDATYGPLTWEHARALAGRQPFCMGGGSWYHWSGVRGTGGDGLHLANPAPGWRGVGQYLDSNAWARLGPWNAVWVTAEDDVSVREDDQLDRLRNELAMRTQRDEELISTMGYINGDIVAAFRHAHEGLRMALDAAQNLAPLREDIRNEAYGHLEAIEAATNSLESQTQP
jgi:hypothetical protein